MAWGVPKLGTSVEDASGDFTLIEPAGVAQGDLMVACIAYRGNAAITLTGWTAVATAQNSGDTDATNGIASGAMYYVVRGSSAPNLNATRTAGDVVLARIISYSGVNISSPYDTGSANTLGSASATVTTGTFSTAEAGELIVAMTSAGDTYNVSAFDAATNPATASGATDTTTAPTNDTWIERSDVSTGTGADGGLGIADGIKATAGATGTIQATVGGSARHVMIAGAFKVAVAPTVTTQAVSSIAQTTATGNGNVTSDGGSTITERGVCWNTSTNPTTSNSKATSAGTTGAYTASLTSLTPSTHYYVRAYAINALGTSYGSNVEFDSLADVTQAAFRLYADGTETGSAALEAQDTNHTADVSGGNVNFQLRTRLQNNGGALVATDDYQLQYELNDSGTYLSVGGYALVARDSHTDTAGNEVDGIRGGTAGSSQAQQALGQTIVPSTSYDLGAVELQLRKISSPTDNLTVSVYTGSETGVLLGTSDVLAGSGITTGAAGGVYMFTFSTPIAISSGVTHYFVVTRSGARDTTNRYTMFGTTDNSYASGIQRSRDNNIWTSSGAFGGGSDLYFQLYEATTPVVGYNSASLTDGNATTNRLGSGTGSFVAGEISEDGLVDDLAITASNYTELLYSLTIESTAVADNDTLDFRVLRNGATTGMTYTVTPRITIEEGGNINLVVADSLSSVTLDNVALTQQNTLVVADSTSSVTVDNVALVQQNTLVVADSLSSTTVESPTTTTDTPLAVADMTSSVTLDAVALTQQNTLAVQDALSSVTLDNVALVQQNTIVVADSLSSATLDNTVITTDTPLVVADSLSSVTLDATTLTQQNTLVVADSLSSVTLDNIALVQQNTLVVADSLSSTTVDNLTLTNDTPLVVADSLSSVTLETTVLTQQNTLVVADSLSSTTVDNLTLESNILLTVADSLSSSTVDNIALVQQNTLVVADSLSSTTVDNVAVTNDTPLTVADSTSSTTLDAVTLTQQNTLAVADSLSSVTLDNVVLTQQNTLAVADALSSSTVDNITLSLGLTLEVQDALSSSTVDNIALTQQNTLVVQDALSSTTVDNTALTQANTLVVADSLSSTTLDSVELTNDTVLVVQDATLSSMVDAVILTQQNILAVQDMTSSSTVDNVSLTQAYNLLVADMTSDTTVSNIDLETELILVVADMASSTTVDNLSLAQANTLIVQDMLSSLTFDNRSLITLVDSRNYYIDSNGNIYWVLNQALGLIEKV